MSLMTDMPVKTLKPTPSPRGEMRTPKKAMAEAVERELARRHLLNFCGYVDPKYPAQARHVQLMTEKLEQVARYIETGGAEGIGRLMVFMPPRYWKSQTASRNFAAWMLGKNPEMRIILTSYGADLASKHSKGVRDLIESKRYHALFGSLSSAEEPVMLDPDSRSAAAWDLHGHRGGMIAAGVGGAITGFGANLLIIDDPFKNREEASSKLRRESVYEWYQSAAYTRLETGGAIIIVMTRWDQEDIAGKLLSAMVSDPEADKWEVLSLRAEALPAEAYPKSGDEFDENLLRGIFVPYADPLGRTEGEALWVEKHDAAALKTIRANISDFEFEAQYQQSPRLAVGNFFDDTDFQLVEKAPDGLQWFRYLDLALGESETSDFNSAIACAMDADGNLYLRDRLKVRNLEAFFRSCIDLMKQENEHGTVWGVEDVAFQRLVFRDFMKDPTLANISVMRLKPNGDKVERARPWQLRAKDGKVRVVKGMWVNDFIREAASFPGGRHDDDVDSISGGVEMIARFSKPRKQPSSFQG